MCAGPEQARGGGWVERGRDTAPAPLAHAVESPHVLLSRILQVVVLKMALQVPCVGR